MQRLGGAPDRALPGHLIEITQDRRVHGLPGLRNGDAEKASPRAKLSSFQQRAQTSMLRGDHGKGANKGANQGARSLAREASAVLDFEGAVLSGVEGES